MMKIDPRPDHFEYDIRAILRFTARDLRVLRYYAERHYDHTCKTFFESGGRGNAWRWSFRRDDEDVDPFDKACPPDLECEFPSTGSIRELDLCLKILEGVEFEREEDLIAEAWRLRGEILNLVDLIHAEYARVRGTPAAPESAKRAAP